jgi:tripartite-type tricarboxylate transporter receptor subunit TctC
MFKILVGTVAAACALVLPVAAQQGFPTRPITIVVPFSAGSGTDTGARILSGFLEKSLSQPVVVENKPGANGAIAATAVAQSKPDGYTLLMGTNSTQSANPHLIKNLPYDPQKDFRPVGLVATFDAFLAVHPSVPAKTIKELVDYGKANPGALTFATGNTTSQVMGELFTRRTGIDAKRIPYKSNPEALTDLVAGRVKMMFPDIASSKGHVDAGTVRVLGTVTMGERSVLAKELPTVSEEVVPELKLVGWIGLFAPTQTPDPVVQRLATAVEAAVKSDEFNKRVSKVGASANFLGPDKLTQHIANESDRFAGIFKELGIEAK